MAPGRLDNRGEDGGPEAGLGGVGGDGAAERIVLIDRPDGSGRPRKEHRVQPQVRPRHGTVRTRHQGDQ